MKNLLILLFSTLSLFACEKEYHEVSTPNAVVPAASGSNTPQGDSIPIAFTEMCKGSIEGGISYALDTVISTAEGWITFKNRMEGINPLSNFCTDTLNDFSDSVILVTFDEQRTNGGYDLSIRSVIAYSNQVKVKLERIAPDSTDMVTFQMNRPYHLVKIPKQQLPIFFVE